MTTYLDVAMVRVQDYLDRSTKLWERRQASHAIVEATTEHAICAALAGLEAHGEAGEADGKLHFVITDDAGRSPARVLDDVYTQLRVALPQAQFEGWWQEADSYVQAADAAHAARTSSMLSTDRAGWADSLPAVCELPIAKRCEGCATAAAVSSRKDPDGLRRWLCPDCMTRQRGRLARWRAGVARPPERERRLIDAVQAEHQCELDLAKEFNDLRPAWAGEPTDDTPAGRGPHHATIHFDGNSLGALFHAVHEPAARSELSAAVTRAVRTALEAATVGCHDPRDRRLLVQPHIMGGDDLLVTVWAPRAWAFARRFTASFDAALADVHRHVGLGADVAAPTISGGIVIAPVTYPFSHARALAEGLLDQAKAKHPGVSAFGWLDVTHDGERVPTGRRPVPSAAFDELDEPLRQLAELPKSARASLARAARANRLATEARRLGHEALANRFGEAPLSLPDALILTRWLR